MFNVAKNNSFENCILNAQHLTIRITLELSYFIIGPFGGGLCHIKIQEIHLEI